jgi:uncharacterized protein (UPF0332 family)
MNLDSRRANIAAELEKASNSLRAARALYELGLFDECVGRAYYAVFHLVCALLLTDGLEARSHRGVDHLLNLHFVRAGRLAPDCAIAFARLAQYRLQADYARAFRFTREAARAELDLAESTSATLRQHLRDDNWLPKDFKDP